MIEIKSLAKVSFKDLVECFLISFEGYFVELPKEKSYYQKRWKAAKIDYDLSFGAFDEGKLVGFVLHGIDVRNGKKKAYNSGTGVVPSHRGKRITEQIYKFALPKLIQNGVQESILEVITENKKAIKVYEKIGFQTIRYYKCYAGEIKIQNKDAKKTQIKAISFSEIDWKKIPNQKNYSWDNQSQTLQNADFSYYQVWFQNELESFFVINKKNGYLAQFEVLNNNFESWERLFLAIQKNSSFIKINNVDTKLESKVLILNKLELKNHIDQYEMVLKL